MRTTHRLLCTAIVVVLCLSSLSLASCSALGETISGPLQLELPRLHVAYDETGEPSILGIRLSSIQRIVPADLSMLRLPAEQMQQLSAWNVQHVELAVAQEGLFIFVNNRSLPHVKWTPDTLDSLGVLLDRLGFIPPTVAPYVSFRKALPWLLTSLGSGIHVEFPAPAGQQVIAFVAHPKGSEATLSDQIEQIGLTVHLPLEYDPAGQPSLEGIPLQEIGSLTGQAAAVGQLDQGTMDTISKLAVEQLVVQMEPRGLVPYVNGQQMPYLSWADDDMVNLIELVETTGLAGTLPGSSQIMDLLRKAAPGFRKADIQISADFQTGP